MTAAVGWGALAASSLLLGVLLAQLRRWPDRMIGLILAFGAGALISAVAFDLAERGIRVGGLGAVAAGLAGGALTYFLLDGAIERFSSGKTHHAAGGPALALAAVLDGLPEQLVLGIGLAAGQEVAVSLLVAVFVSNLPEGIGSAADLRGAGYRSPFIWLLWIAVAAACASATVAGYIIGDTLAGLPNAAINGFAAGGLLVMLIDSMIPEARDRAGRVAGIATVIGFAAAAALAALQ